MRWLALGVGALAVGIVLFGLIGWWVIGREEGKLDDGDPNNPYSKDWKGDG
jgi:hypothetical protein